MKIIAAITLVLASSAYAGTDYTCMSRCSAQGYMYGYCKSACSYSTNIGGRTDYTCMSNCSAQGYLYGYCKSACSY